MLQENIIYRVNWQTLTKSKRDGGLGFRDLCAFNLALLGKQIWHIITEPNSLLSRVFKSKYIPNCDVLNAIPKANASFTWKSIWAAKDLLCEVIRWRVGNGDNIDIWNDKWILGTLSFKPKSTPDLRHEGPLRVSFFIHPSLNEWDLPILNFLFWDDAIQEIMKIPLVSKDAPDVQVWHYTHHGCYTVRSGYHLAMDRHNRQHENQLGSTSRHMQRNWNFVWSIKTPNKVKHFLYRILHNSLATHAELQRRHLSEQSSCVICGEEGETILHILRD